MNGHHLSLFWTSEYLYSRISGETFLIQTLQIWHWTLPVSSSVFVIVVVPTLLAGFLAGVARRNARVFASAAWVKSLPCWGMPHIHKDVQIQYNTTTRCLYLRACPPSSSSLVILLYFVRLVISRATHHGVCRLQNEDGILFLDNYRVLLRLSSVKLKHVWQILSNSIHLITTPLPSLLFLFFFAVKFGKAPFFCPVGYDILFI